MLLLSLINYLQFFIILVNNLKDRIIGLVITLMYEIRLFHEANSYHKFTIDPIDPVSFTITKIQLGYAEIAKFIEVGIGAFIYNFDDVE